MEFPRPGYFPERHGPGGNPDRPVPLSSHYLSLSHSASSLNYKNPRTVSPAVVANYVLASRKWTRQLFFFFRVDLSNAGDCVFFLQEGVREGVNIRDF